MRQHSVPWLITAIAAAGYGVLIRVLFQVNPLRDFVTVMSLSFLVAVPFGIGYLTVALSAAKRIRSLRFRIFAPWVPIFCFLFITLLFGIEGWACWLMILPFFLLFASLGGVIAGAWRIRRMEKANKLQISLIVLLPLMLAPLEKLLPLLPARYEAYTYTDIHASATTIWNHVLRVEAIPAEADRGSLTRVLGFPRPIRAELDFAGVGGSRQAIFSKGLVFEEVVKEYQDQKKMAFSIKADPHSIPSTTMDEHVVIGGDYFDVLDGMYVLERLNDSVCRLHLYSHFTLRTSFNFYASWWAGLIMKDIQNNILQVIQTRCEGKF
jgi:hypothetical protein